MFEFWIQKLTVDDAGDETPAQTRDRLRDHFAPGAVRRMTQLGMLVGGALRALEAGASGVVVYASSYGESRALEAYLDSFPSPSPTLFQTSIHPSGAQQGLIGRQQAVRELYPLSGDKFLAGQALATAALAGAGEVVICGGEERGTYLLEHGVASERAFGFALLLGREPRESSLGRLLLRPADTSTDGGLQTPAPPSGSSTIPGRIESGRGLSLPAFFDLLKNHEPFEGGVAPGWHARLTWR